MLMSLSFYEVSLSSCTVTMSKKFNKNKLYDFLKKSKLLSSVLSSFVARKEFLGTLKLLCLFL